MNVHWEDLELVEVGELSLDCRLDPTTGHFTDDPYVVGYRLLHTVCPRPDERAAWSGSMNDPLPETMTNARWLMQELRVRRAIAIEHGATNMLAVLDDYLGVDQRAAVEAYAASRFGAEKGAHIRERYAALTSNLGDRDDAIMWSRHFAQYLDEDHELTQLRLRVFDHALRAHADASEALAAWKKLAFRSAVWEWAGLLRQEPSNEPSWLPEVLAWREREEERSRVRVADLLRRLDRCLETQAPDVTCEPGAEDVDDAFEEWLPPALVQLWSWHDGGGEIAPFGYGFDLLSIDDAQNDRAASSEEFAAAPQWWGPNWIPFLRDPSDNKIVVGDIEGTPYQVIAFWHDDTDRDVLAYDLEGFLDTLVSMYETNMFGSEHSASMWDYSVAWRRRYGISHPTFNVDPP